MAEPGIGRVLHGVLVVVTLVAALGLLKATVLSKTPRPTEWAWELPLIDGYRWETLPGQPAATGRDHAHGPVHHFRLRAETGDSSLMLTMASVHSRHSDDFHLDALLGALPLDRSNAAQSPSEPRPFASPSTASARLVRGNDVLELQTCVVLGAGTGVTSTELAALVNQQRVRGWRQSLEQVLGLQHNVQWACLLLSLASPDGTSAEAEITRLGRLLMEKLQNGQSPNPLKAPAAAAALRPGG